MNRLAYILICVRALAAPVAPGAGVHDDTGWRHVGSTHTVNQQCWVTPYGQQICPPQSQVYAQPGYYQQAAQQSNQQPAVSSVPGPRGEPGPPGPPGATGPPGPAAVIDHAEIAAKIRESFEPLRMTEIDYDTLAPKLAQIIHADIKAGLLPELQGPPGLPAEPVTLPPIETIAEGVAGVLGKSVAPTGGMPFGLTVVEFALSALGLGGGAALPIWAAWQVLRTVRAARKYDGPPSPSNHNTTGSEAREAIPFPIAVDAPPTPQYRGVEQRFVTVESDRYAQAHAYAKEQLARRYPGAVDVLEAEKALITQWMAGDTKK